MTVKYYLLAFTLFVAFTNILTAQVLEQDSLALIAIYDSTDGNNWTNNENWLVDKVSNWHGITVTDDRVTGINLSINNLVGVIPNEIGDLSSLKTLSIYSNKLTGEIPPEIFSLPELISLSLANNQLSGEIPLEIENLSNLELLTLGNNKLTGIIPNELCNLSNLKILSLGDNQFTGGIPTEITSLTNLRELYLPNLNLSGEFPVDLLTLINLEDLNLSENELTGSIPSQIDNLENLERLLLYENQLTGEIPSEIGNLTNLIYLSLYSNQLEGEIPIEIWHLSLLKELNLGDNKLTGVLPSEMENLITLKDLSLGTNNFEGEIPSEIGNLINLQYISIGRNGFTGSLPEEITNLGQLKNLYIFNNSFSGLPDLSTMTNLLRLNIIHNQFTFEDIEPNLGVPATSFDYSPQDSIGERIDTTIAQGSNITFTVNVGGSSNNYQWIKNDLEIEGAVGPSITILSADSSDAGKYICRIGNSLATDLTLFCREIKLSIEGLVDIENTEPEIQLKFALYQNYPNPFNPATAIKYSIPEPSFARLNAQNVSTAKYDQNVKLVIYDILGQEVATLVNKMQKPGNYEISWNAENYPSGIYIYHLVYKNMTEAKKLILLK